MQTSEPAAPARLLEGAFSGPGEFAQLVPFQCQMALPAPHISELLVPHREPRVSLGAAVPTDQLVPFQR